MKTEVLISCMFHVILSTNLHDKETHAAENDYNDYQLPDTTEPVSYDLRIKPIVDSVNKNYTFSGLVEIVIRAKWYAYNIKGNLKKLSLKII